MDAKKALERIRHLMLRTETRGASQAEAEAAAKLVVTLLSRFPELLQEPPTSLHDDWEPPPERHQPTDDSVCLQHRGVLKHTDKAVLLWIQGREVWLPISQIFVTAFHVTMPRWLAKKHNLA